MANRFTKSARDSRDVHGLGFYKFAMESLPVAIMTVDPELRTTGFTVSFGDGRNPPPSISLTDENWESGLPMC